MHQVNLVKSHRKIFRGTIIVFRLTQGTIIILCSTQGIILINKSTLGNAENNNRTSEFSDDTLRDLPDARVLR